MKKFAFLILISVLPLLVFRGAYAYFLSIMTIAGIYAIVAISLNLLIGYTGQISLCHAGFFGLGAYSAAVTSVSYGINPWLSLVSAVLIPGIIASIVGFPTVKLKEHYLAMATLGIGIIIYALLRANPLGITGGPGGICSIPSLHVFGQGIDSDTSHYIVVFSFLFVVFLFSHALLSSRFGDLMEAIHTSPHAALSLGINVNITKLKVFILSASMAGLAGGLYAFLSPLSYINPDDVASVMLSIKFIAMVVIGGSTSIIGGVSGAIILTWLPEVLRIITTRVPGISPSDMESVIYGVALIAIMVMYPYGLVHKGKHCDNA